MNAEDKERAENVALLRKATALSGNSWVGAVFHDAANDLDANRDVADLESILADARETVKESEQ